MAIISQLKNQKIKWYAIGGKPEFKTAIITDFDGKMVRLQDMKTNEIIIIDISNIVILLLD